MLAHCIKLAQWLQKTVTYLQHESPGEMPVHLRPQVIISLDPVQPAYCLKDGVEDVIICLLQWAHSHLHKAGSTVRKDTQSSLYCSEGSSNKCRLTTPQPPGLLITLPTDILHYMWLRGWAPEQLVRTTGAPHHLSPSHLRLPVQIKSCHLQKFSEQLWGVSIL